MDVKSEVIEIIDELFYGRCFWYDGRRSFDAGVLDSMGTVELIVELESRFDIRVPVSEFGRDDWNTASKIVEGITSFAMFKRLWQIFWSSSLGLGSGSLYACPQGRKHSWRGWKRSAVTLTNENFKSRMNKNYSSFRYEHRFVPFFGSSEWLRLMLFIQLF